MIRSRNSDKRPWMMIAVLMAAIVAAGCGGQTAGETDEEESTLPTQPVEAVSARRMTLHPSVQLVGRVVAIPERTAIISPHIGRWIESVKVVEGQRVYKGKTMIVLYSRLAEAELKKARAKVDEQAAILARLKPKYRPQEIEMTRQDMYKAQADAEALQIKLKALDNLRKQNPDDVSDVTYRALAASLSAAENAHKAADEKLKLYQLGTRPEDIDKARAQLAGANADLDTATLAVDFCTITCPIDGIVTNLSARQGLFVERATPLATIVDNSHLFAQIRIPGVYLSQVGIGTPAKVEFASLPEQMVDGTVARLSGQADPTTGDIDAFVEIANPKGLLQPGLSCRVRVLLPEVPDAVAVPTIAIADRSGTPVLTVVRDKKAYEIEVTLGVQTEKSVQVKTGVSPGELVITRGGYGLPAGCPVKVTISQPIAPKH